MPMKPDAPPRPPPPRNHPPRHPFWCWLTRHEWFELEGGARTCLLCDEAEVDWEAAHKHMSDLLRARHEAKKAASELAERELPSMEAARRGVML